MSLSPDEQVLARSVGFEEDICELIKAHTRSRLERVVGIGEDNNAEPGNGISVAVKDEEAAEKLMSRLCAALASHGYRAFWSERRKPNGLGDTNEVVILKTTDPFAIIRFRRSDGGNYDISTADIIDRLTAWSEICAFDVVGASSDWVALQFQRLPEKICAFAEEVYQFCPDSVGQGVGLLHEENELEKFKAARRLCPEISTAVMHREADALAKIQDVAPELLGQFQDLLHAVGGYSTPTDMGVRLLAYEMQRTRYLFLWWD